MNLPIYRLPQAVAGGGSTVSHRFGQIKTILVWIPDLGAHDEGDGHQVVVLCSTESLGSRAH